MDTRSNEAMRLLEIHDGACSVPGDSRFGHAFAVMQIEGKVRIDLSSTPGFINVYSANHKARFTAPKK